MELAELTVRGFTEEIASASPAPGGGSAAALAGAVGAALTAMVSGLTLGRKKYEAVQELALRAQAQADVLRKRLLAAMEHASRCVEDKNLKAALDDDESHSGGIGTPATRADTIEKLVRSKLVERKGRQLHATTEGERLTDVVEPRLKDVLLTARMEQALSDVEHGKRGPSEVMDMFHREALRIPADATANLKADAVTRTANTDAQEWGCGQPVRKTGRMWQCSTNKTEKTKDGKWATTAGCGWKMFARIAGKTITDQTARRLLAGQSVTLKGFTSKSGKKFDAAIRIDKERGTAFDFDR